MEKITLFLMFVLWVTFCMLEGKRDGSFYHANMKTHDPVKENLHWLYFSTRFIVLWLMFVVTMYAYPNQFRLWHIPIKSSLFFMSLCLVFSFVHNGVYYAIRHKLDSNVYPKGFWDDSVSSTATINMNVKTRTIMAVIGVLGVITSIIIS